MKEESGWVISQKTWHVCCTYIHFQLVFLKLSLAIFDIQYAAQDAVENWDGGKKNNIKNFLNDLIGIQDNSPLNCLFTPRPTFNVDEKCENDHAVKSFSFFLRKHSNHSIFHKWAKIISHCKIEKIGRTNQFHEVITTLPFGYSFFLIHIILGRA